MAVPTALVPLRALGAGKTRLARAQAPQQRAALAGAMLADVCHALDGAGLPRIVVAAGGASAAAAASALGVEVVLDPPGVRDLDGALAAATLEIGADGPLLIVTADLPRLATHDVRRVLEADTPVVIAPTDDGGTGGLLRRPATAFPTAYGPGSAARHRRAAHRAGLEVTTVTAAGFAADVDTPGDLAALRDGRVGAATRAVLGRLLPTRQRTG